MPNITLYVAEEDRETFDEARVYAKGDRHSLSEILAILLTTWVHAQRKVRPRATPEQIASARRGTRLRQQQAADRQKKARARTRKWKG